jgi:hypothetical protein
MRPPDPNRTQASVPDSAPESSFLARYARRFGLVATAAEQRLFYECVPVAKRLPVRLHRWLRPNLYGSDLRLVREAGQAMGRQEVMDALDRWHHRASRIHAWEREAFGWRVSGRLLLALARTLFQATELAAAGEVKPATTALVHRDAGLSRPPASVPAARQSAAASSHWIQRNG